MTFALALGRGIGRSAATVVHAACVSASYTGNFGKDVAEGAVTGYVDNAERLAAARLAVADRRSIAVTVVAVPARRKATA